MMLRKKKKLIGLTKFFPIVKPAHDTLHLGQLSDSEHHQKTTTVTIAPKSAVLTGTVICLS